MNLCKGGLTIFTNQIPGPEEIQKNIIVVYPDPSAAIYSTMDIHSKSFRTKLAHTASDTTPLQRPAH